MDLEVMIDDVPMEATPTAGAGNSAFEPSVWDDFFVSYTPPCSEMSEQLMRERAKELQMEVHHMFEAGNGMSVAGLLILVDCVQRLGIDNYFQEKIDTTLSRLHTGDLEIRSPDELHIVALRFRLLRQHGHFVPTDVFDDFKDGMGNFKTRLTSDPKGLLSLYNAAHMAVPGEDVLDDAIAFARTHLEALKGNLTYPIADQICRSLDIPLPRHMPQFETMHFIKEYEQEDGHNTTILELARLDYCLTRSAHLKELRTCCLWWKDYYKDVNLTYSRDRGVETYFWSFGVVPHGERNSRARVILFKIIAFLTLMDDTYDSYGTFEDLKTLNEAIQRWDESAVSILPEYLRMYYTRLLGFFKELEDSLEPGEKYRVPYLQNEVKLQSKCYIQETKWLNENYVPNFKEQLVLSTMTASGPLQALGALMPDGCGVTTKEAFEWASGAPDIFHASGEIGRILNDIAAFKVPGRRNKNDIPSTMECYMKEHGTTGEEAETALSAMVEHAWRRINKALMQIDQALMPAASTAVSQARLYLILYNGGNCDGYTIATKLADFVSSMFLKPLSQLNDE